MSQFDYLIIGGGLAGLQLAITFTRNTSFKNKRIGLIEPSSKSVNDKTWCFWEKGKGQWDHILFHQWEKARFTSNKHSTQLDMGSYQYKMIRSIDFYNEAKKLVEASENIEWIQDEIHSQRRGDFVGRTDVYRGDIVFDSRISEHFYADQEHIKIKQHFKGWLIESTDPIFNPDEFTMMDYSIGYKDLCFFTYVLPISTTKALIEATFFTKSLVPEKVYDALLKQYIADQLKIHQYSIREIERGIIPMSDYPFYEENTSSYLKIGTGGGWVKASSGYSFKSTEKKVNQVVANLRSGQNPGHDLFKKRFQFYDRIFLRILKNENHLGNKIFTEMYERNPAHLIFKFLDEETKIREEFNIINSFNKAPFLRSLKKEIQ